jgi:hypothetical protein
MLCEESERLMALLNGQRVAKPPFFEPWFGMGQMRRDLYADDYLTMARELGHAAVPIGGLNIGMDFTNAVKPLDGSGAYYAGGKLRSIEQVRNAPEPDYAEQIEPIRQRRQAAADAGRACWMVIGWCFDRTSSSMGLENLAMAFYDEPDFIREVMTTYEARNRRAAEVILTEVRPDFVLYNGDCAFKNGPMVAPEMIREFCFDASKQTVDLVRDMGIPFTFHTDGKLNQIIPILLDLGICAVHGCEKQANDLGELVEAFGDQIVLCGNADVVELMNATTDGVRQMTERMLETGAAKQKFIAGCNTSPKDYIPVENYQTFCRTVADWQP